MKKTLLLPVFLFSVSWSYMIVGDDFRFSECPDKDFTYCGTAMVCNETYSSKGCSAPAIMNVFITEDSIIKYEIKPLIIRGKSLESSLYQGIFEGFVDLKGGTCYEFVDPRKISRVADSLIIQHDSAKVFNVPKIDYCMTEMYDREKKKVVKRKMSNYLKGVDLTKLLPD